MGGHNVRKPSTAEQNRTAKKGKKKKNGKEEIVFVCCITQKKMPKYDTNLVVFIGFNSDMICFDYDCLLKVVKKGETYFPHLPGVRPKNFDVIEYLNKTRAFLESDKATDAKKIQTTLGKISEFLDETKISKYVGSLAEFIRFGLKPTFFIE